jgi:hypothetical protein
MNVKLINLTKTSTEWATFDTVIPKGMLCVEQVVDGSNNVLEVKTKVGDGTNTFAALPYVTTRVMTGATASTAGTSGMVPAPAAGDQTKFLTGAGTWESIEIAAPLQYRVILVDKSATTGAADKFKLQVSSDAGQTWTDVDTGTTGVKNIDLGLFATTASGSDEIGKIKSILLPSYVDDVVEGYYHNGKFYKEAAHTTEITAEAGKIYVDIPTSHSYRWSGTAYVDISNPLDAATIYQLMGVDTTDGDFNGPSGSNAGQHGLVPAPASGDGAKFLRADATWQDVVVPTDNLVLNVVPDFTT